MGCATSEQLAPLSEIQPSVASEGSLANEQLILDATAGLSEYVDIPAGSKVLKFVIQQPVGKVGKRAWREVWVANPDTNPIQFIITFQEAGLGAADFVISKM